MNITDITKLVTVVLAVSIAGERLVTFLKTMIPWLAGSQVPTQQPDSTSEIARKLCLIASAFLACWATATLADTNDLIKPPLLGLLASGGSAFWTNILTYLKGVATIKQQNGVQEKINSANLLVGSPAPQKDDRSQSVLGTMSLSPQPVLNSLSTIKH